jgi:hypothetical protein
VPITQLGLQQRADFIRAYLLTHYGGVWLDSDFVLLRPLNDLRAVPEPYTFCGYRQEDGRIANNLLFSRPGDRVLADLYERICAHLRAGREVWWSALGQHALNPAINAHPDVVRLIDRELVCPIPWHQHERFEVPGDAEDLVRSPRIGVMLFNAMMGARWGDRSRDDVLAGDSVLGDLLRRALA